MFITELDALIILIFWTVIIKMQDNDGNGNVLLWT